MKTLIASVVALLLGSVHLNADCLLRGVQYLETGSEQSDIAVADFNNDGLPDVAVTGVDSGLVRTFQNQGDGTFVMANSKRLKSRPLFIAVADFNGDTNADLAIASSGSVTVLLNDGHGKFPAMLHFAVPSPIAFAAVDLNSDTRSDLAVLTRKGSNGRISIFMNSNGSFVKTQDLAAKSPVDMIAARLGSAAHPDLVVLSERGAIIVFKGSGSGTFQQMPDAQAVQGGRRLASGFINSDDLLDLVVAGIDGEIAVMLGVNENGFRKIRLSTDSDIERLALGDFNSDQHQDLLIVNRNFRASLYSGNGNGGFSFARGFSFSFLTGPLVAADFNLDNHTDFVATEAGAAGIFLGDGKSNFVIGARKILDQGGNVFAGDFDADGRADLLISKSNETIFMRGKGNGSFEPPAKTILPQIGYGIAVDLNGDGRVDFAGFDQFKLKVWLSSGSVRFKEALSVSVSADPPIQALDLNGDGLLDMAIKVPYRLFTLLNEGGGQFKTHVISLNNDQKGTLADFNGDGMVDLASISQDNRKKLLRVYLGAPGLVFNQNSEVPLEGCPDSISAGDANGDGNADVVIGSSCDSRVTLLLGDGAAGFAAPRDIPAGSGAFDLNFVDFNNDGKDEILGTALNVGKPSISIAPDFRDYQLLGPFNWNHTAVADFNGDGFLDLAASSFNSTAIFMNCR